MHTLTVFALSLAASVAPADRRFVVPRPPRPIYHAGWIDLNKNGVKDPYEDPFQPVEARVSDLLSRMTLEEKTAQMVTLYGFPRVLKDELPTEAWHRAVWKDGVGNIDEHMNGNAGPKGEHPDPVHDLPWSLHTRAMNDVQRFFVEDTRLGIPADMTNEGIRGLLHSRATSFPAQLGVGATFDVDLVHAIGRVTGREAKALGYTNVYSPVLDLPRDPRWGRTTECYSEDPFLTSEMGMAQVRGIQAQGVVSTLKHFAVYSVPKGGRDGEARTDPQVTWRDVQTIFLHPFRKAVRDAGALGAMASYNDYDGVPVEGSRLFLTEILRGEYGFKGYVVSDSHAVEYIHSKHRVAPNLDDAVRQAVEAGLNVRTNFAPPAGHVEALRRLAKEGKLSGETLDARVRDILRVKFWMGLFDQPYRQDPSEAEKVVRAPEHLEMAARAARESIVLLKNDGLLPLRKELKKVLVTGPLAHDPQAWWSRYAPQRLDFVTVLDAIRRKLPDADVRHVQGTPVKDARWPESDAWKEPPTEAEARGIAAAVEAARDVDVVVAVLGESDDISRESASRISLDLPGQQEVLLRALHATGKPVVLVLSSGRPLSVNWASRHIPAITQMWFPGEEGGSAMADVLFGDHNPAGRLPVTFPKSVGQLPYNFPVHPNAQARDGGQIHGALWPFGHGLSYTTFRYANLRITPERQGTQGSVTVAFDVTNTGRVAGDEVPQLYLRDDYSSVTTFEKVLRGFRRIHLAPGETRALSFTLNPEHMALYDRTGHWTVEPGRFTVWAGASSEDLRLTGTFMLGDNDPQEAPVKAERSDPR